MGQNTYSQWFKQQEWIDLNKKVCQKLTYEPVLLTALPDAGLTIFVHYIQETLRNLKNMDHLFLNITPQKGQISMEKFEIDLRRALEQELQQKFEDISIEQVFEVVLSQNKEIFLTINYLERLTGYPNLLLLLKTLRSLNPFKVHILIRSDISCITNPQKYNEAAILTKANVYILPQFNESGIRHQIRQYQRRFGWKVKPTYAKDIEKLTGGIPGLVKYTAKFISENGISKLTLRNLLRDSSINYKISNIYKTLVINKLIKAGKLNSERVDLLHKLGVITTKGNVRISLIEEYMQTAIRSAGTDTIQKELTKQEFSLFEFLKSRKDKIVTLEEISKTLWGNHAEAKFSLWSMYKILSNLKAKLKKYNYQINNLRGRGYILSNR